MHHLKSRNNIEMSCLKADLMPTYEYEDIDLPTFAISNDVMFYIRTIINLLIW